MADHNKPVLTSTYTNFVSELDARFDDLALMLDPANTTATNVPTNSIRWNSALAKFQKYNGTSWGDLSATYNFTAGAFTTLSATGDINQTTGGASDISMFSNNSAGSARFGVRASGNAVVLAGTGKSLELWANNSQIGTVSSTGLAVTGALSASGALTTLNGTFKRTDDANQYAYAQFADAAAVSASNLTWGIGKPNSSNNLAIWSFDGSSISTKFVIDTSGNLGLGVTPSAWSQGRAIEIGTAAGNAIWGQGADDIRLMSNAYYNGGYKYANTNQSCMFSMADSSFTWFTAPSGTAGNAITFTERMNLSSTGLVVTGSVTSSSWMQPADNFGISWSAGNTYLQGSTAGQTMNFVINGTQRGQFNATGLAVTGALSASGGITNTATGANSTLTLSGTGAYSSIITLNASGGGSGLVTSAGASADLLLGAPVGRSVIQQINNTSITTVSSTGLAVTGALSATGIQTLGATGASDTQLRSGVLNTSTTYFQAISADGTTAKAYKWYAGALDVMNLDTAGNLGLGVTPVSSQGRSFQFSVAGALESEAINTNDHRTNLTSNAISVTPYVNAYKYLLTGASATMYQQAAGLHRWFTAPSGTAGNAITFTQAMTLDASGSFLVGGTSLALNSGGFAVQPGVSGYINIGHGSAAVSGAVYTQYLINGTSIGSITQNGTTGIAVNSSANLNLTGTSVTAPTPATTDDSTKVATTAYVRDNTIGVDQTWQNMAGSRTSGTTYTNSTGKPIQVSVACQAVNTIGSVTVGGVSLAGFTNSGGSAPNGNTFIVPTGATYVVTISGGTFSIWAELR